MCRYYEKGLYMTGYNVRKELYEAIDGVYNKKHKINKKGGK